MSSRRLLITRGLLALAATAALGAAAPAAALAEPDPTNCVTDPSAQQFDPSVPTWDQHFNQNPGTGAIQPYAAGAPGRSSGKNTTANLERYFDAVQSAVAGSDRVRIVRKPLGKSALGDRGVAGRNISFWVIGTPEHVTRLDTVTGDPATTGDADFWAGVRSGKYSKETGLAAVRSRPAFGWITATPHGNEPAAGEAIVRNLYETAAGLSCDNAKRLRDMTLFLMPVRNADGRDNNVRTSAWGFDHNRDFGTRNQVESNRFVPQMNQYPGVFYIDAHQQATGYFFPPNEDPILHEISDFSRLFIQNRIGPELQKTFNDQSAQYENYNAFDLFTPQYGDTVPSLIMGAAGMTYEKGVSESYGKQVYDHYLAIDKTVNLTVEDKADILAGWVAQWQEAVDQGTSCTLQANKLVSPLHDEYSTPVQPVTGKVCGYFYKPGKHAGDVSALMQNLREVGVRVYRLDTPVNTAGVHEFGQLDPNGKPASKAATLPAGTLWIPMAQSQKHWIQAVLGEDPFIPYNYYYDVVTWSYSLQRGMAGNGYLTENLPAGVVPTEITGPLDTSSVPAAASPVYAFNTDSARGLGLVADLLAADVNVYRGDAAFTADGEEFLTGAALVDGASLAASGASLATLAAKRQTPVSGLGGYPVPRFQLSKPKIGLYTGAATVPSNPLNVTVDANGVPTRGTGQCSGSFCEALFTLTQKDGIAEALVVPVTSADLADGALVSGGFTAFVNPGTTIGAGAGATALQAFISGGGRYVGTNTGGTASARNAAVTTLDTASIPGLLTPGSTFDATFDTSNPVAWGFDEGGWIYRDATGNPVYNPAGLAGDAALNVPAAAAPVRFGGTTATGDAPLHSYGYQVNAVGDGKLDGRPAVVDQPYGTGRSILMSFNPFFRAWKEQDERLVLNAVLYPRGAALPAAPGAPPRRAVSAGTATDAGITPAAAPVPVAKRASTKEARPLAAVSTTDRDVRITVARKALPKLKAAVSAARLPKGVKRKLRYVVTAKRATLVIKGVRTSDEHGRKAYVGRITQRLKSQRVKVLAGQL